MTGAGARRRKDCDAPLGRRRDDVPLAVDAEVVCRDDARRIGDVHASAVVGVGADQHRTALRIEREVCDVDVARRPEDAAWFPVQQTVRVQQHTDPVEIRHQFVGPASTRKHRKSQRPKSLSTYSQPVMAKS